MERVERATIEVCLGELKTLQDHFIVIGRKGPFFEKLLGVIESFRRIFREHALIEKLRRRQRRSIAKHHLEKLQVFNVTAKDHEADRQRSGKDETDRPPQRGPERGGHHNGNR